MSPFGVLFLFLLLLPFIIEYSYRQPKVRKLILRSTVYTLCFLFVFFIVADFLAIDLETFVITSVLSLLASMLAVVLSVKFGLVEG